MADDNCASALRVFLFRKKASSGDWLDTEQRKEVRCNCRPLDPFRFRRSDQVDACVRKGSDIAEGRLLSAPIQKVPRRDLVAIVDFLPGLSIGFPNCDQTFGVRIWKRTQQDSIDDTKNCGVYTNSKSKSCDSDEGKRRLL